MNYDYWLNWQCPTTETTPPSTSITYSTRTAVDDLYKACGADPYQPVNHGHMNRQLNTNFDFLNKRGDYI